MRKACTPAVGTLIGIGTMGVDSGDIDDNDDDTKNVRVRYFRSYCVGQAIVKDKQIS
jgi:hypothetical protein